MDDATPEGCGEGAGRGGTSLHLLELTCTGWGPEVPRGEGAQRPFL